VGAMGQASGEGGGGGGNRTQWPKGERGLGMGVAEGQAEVGEDVEEWEERGRRGDKRGGSWTRGGK